MAAPGSWGEAVGWMRLRVDSSQVQRDAEQGLDRVDFDKAGQRGGAQFSAGFGKASGRQLRDDHGRFMKQVSDDSGGWGGKAGSVFSIGFGHGAKAGIVKTFDGIGPAILGISAKWATMVTGGAVLAAALPAVTAAAAAFASLAAGAGVAAAGFGLVQAQLKDIITAREQAEKAAAKATTPAQAEAAAAQMAAVKAQIAQLSPALQQILKSEDQIRKTWEGFTKSLAPLFVGPVQAAAAQLGTLTGPLREMFAGAATLATPLINALAGMARTVLPQLGQMFRATAPLVQPLVNGLSGLVANILPGLTKMLAAAGPAASAFAGVLTGLGSALGTMFSQFADSGVITASAQVLASLGQIVNALLPTIGRLAQIFAQTLAPVFAEFATVVTALLPFFAQLGQLVADFAGAVLVDLTAAFRAVSTLLTAISPALTAFISALSGVFVMLENSGVFAMIGTALEQLAAPLAQLISALLNGLTPILPVVIGFIGQLAAMFATSLAQAVAAIIPPLTTLATAVLGTIAQILPAVLPLLASLAGVFTAAVVGTIQAVAAALNAIVTAIPPSVLGPIVLGLYGLSKASEAMGAAMKLLAAGPAIIRGISAALSLLAANPVGAVVTAIGLLAIALYTAWQKSAAFRDGIKAVASGFLEFGQVIVGAAKWLTDSVLSFFGSILHGAATAFGWIPGIGGKLREASAAFDSFKAGVDRVFQGAITTMQGWQDSLNSAVSTSKTAAASITGDFQRQAQAAANARSSLDTYTQTVQTHSVTSEAARQARTNLINDMIKAGVNANTARTDVGNYTAAVAQNGATSSATAGPRAKLIADILATSQNAARGRTDMLNYTSAVAKNGTDSDAARAARTRLINDLIAAGVDSKTARDLVDKLGSAVKNLPADKKLQLTMTGTGTYSLSEINASTGKQQEAATGGRVRGPGGPRSDKAGLFALSNNEWVIQASSAQMYGPAAMAAINAGRAVVAYGGPDIPVKGLAAGGVAAIGRMAGGGQVTLGTASPENVNKWYAANQKALTDAMVKAMREAIKKAIESGGKGSAAIVNDAMSWLGKIPYVWGGTSLTTGCDCSGFTQAIYRRHGISAPRTSEAQGAWVRRTGPVPGGLAFYDSPAGGPPPGHVALVRDKGSVISQGGGMGPQLQALGNALWTGIPPNGFAKGGRIPEPVRGIGRYTRALYSFGEEGPEWVIPEDELAAGGGDDRVAGLLRRLIDVTAAGPAETGRHVGDRLDGTAAAAAFRARYPGGGL